MQSKKRSRTQFTQAQIEKAERPMSSRKKRKLEEPHKLTLE